MTLSVLETLAANLRGRGEPYAVATVVRTLGATAAKPGAKAILDAEGAILSGWVGGGCVRAALARATRRAVAEGAPQLVSVAPRDLMTEAPGARGGVEYAASGCPSEGSLDIFVEPVLPRPALGILGESPVAKALAELAPRFGWEVSEIPEAGGMTVIATQGKGDMEALAQALDTPGPFVGFVASARKWEVLAGRLRAKGTPEEAIARVRAPVGLPIGAVTPDEIALSILAELIRARRT